MDDDKMISCNDVFSSLVLREVKFLGDQSNTMAWYMNDIPINLRPPDQSFNEINK